MNGDVLCGGDISHQFAGPAWLTTFAERAKAQGAVVLIGDPPSVCLGAIEGPANGSVRSLFDDHDETHGLVCQQFTVARFQLRVAIPTDEKASQTLASCGEGTCPPMPRIIAERLVDLLVPVATDLERLATLEDDSSHFTEHLTQAYETISLLYRLGRTMGDVRSPGPFAERSLEGVLDLLGFSWGALLPAGDERLRCGVSARPRVVGDADETEIARRTLEIVGRPGTHDIPAILPTKDPVLGDELIVQTVRTADGEAATLVLGGKTGARGYDNAASSVDVQAAEAVAAYIGTVFEGARLYREQESTLLGSLRALTGSLDAKDRYTRGHSERVAILGRDLALAIGLTEQQADRIRLTGTLHDIGKIGVPDAVLCKPGRLTDEEFEAIKRHPVLGYDILRGIPTLDDVLPGVRHHHERWDGMGYPDGLAGEDIPLVARILAVADTFDAMSSNRAYRDARPREFVLKVIGEEKGKQFDPDIAEAMLTLDLSAYDAMMAQHASEKTETQAKAA